MLKSLFISSFVIIDQTTVDFDEGMTALTGETGAGKSIIINALEQLCGARASSSLVRKGSKKAVIEGVFDMNDSIQKILDELNIDVMMILLSQKRYLTMDVQQLKSIIALSQIVL